MNTTCETLISARALISNVDDWCQGVYAQDASGVVCMPCAAEARRWCVIGAIWRVSPNDVKEAAVDALCNAAFELGYFMRNENQDRPTIAIVNDGIGNNDTRGECHTKVIAMYDRAIANLGVEEEKEEERSGKGN